MLEDGNPASQRVRQLREPTVPGLNVARSKAYLSLTKAGQIFS